MFNTAEPHVGCGDRYADRLGINGIVLVLLHMGPYAGRRHQANRVTKRLKFARPMMRRGAGFDTD
jgi:hypothetical protein